MTNSASESASAPELLYVADPMCSWCFAFAPVFASVRRDLLKGIAVRYVLGGLAPDDDQPMDPQVREYIQGAWRSIEKRTSARFNWDYWERCTPRRSTWPACRAVLVAGDRGEEMFEAIQRAYYQEARDPSDIGELIRIASELGFDGDEFARALQSESAMARLEAEFVLRNQLGTVAFPSVGVRRGDEFKLISSGWVDEPELRRLLALEGLTAGG